MPLRDVRMVLIRAATDPDFRKRLLNTPDEVFSRYDLTDEEKQSLRAVNSDEQLELCFDKIEGRGDLAVSDIRI